MLGSYAFIDICFIGCSLLYFRSFIVYVVVSFKIDGDDFMIDGVVVREQREDFGERKTQVLNTETFQKFVTLIKSGQNQTVTDSQIIASTGATTKKSVAGLNRAVTRAIDTMNKIYLQSDAIKTEISKRGGQDE